MAEGYVYFIRAEEVGLIKIGWAIDPNARLGQHQCSSPVELVPLAAIAGVPEDERRLHDTFWRHRVRGEWFRPAPELLEFIRDSGEPWPTPDEVTAGETVFSMDCRGPARPVSGDGRRCIKCLSIVPAGEWAYPYLSQRKKRPVIACLPCARFPDGKVVRSNILLDPPRKRLETGGHRG